MNSNPPQLELSVVIPCLNEADTLSTCIRKARQAAEAEGLAYEIVVADNGSVDRSREIAAECGARVVPVAARGYGSALMAGIEAAQGRYVLMADADDSYDFLEIPKFVRKIREGYDIVQGCRRPTGGGTILPGAMPWMHRWIGNPLFTRLSRILFKARIHDIYCGMRIFTREHYLSLNQRCTGMEFATEMIIKSSLFGARMGEVPITLHKDGRVAHPPHLKTFRDGWRTIRFFLMCSPKWLFLVPGSILILAGLAGYALALPATRLGNAVFDAHTLLFSTLAILGGYQAILFAIFAKTFAINEGILPRDPLLERFTAFFELERGLLLSFIALLFGGGLLLLTVRIWWLADFGRLNYAVTMRYVIPGATLVALGLQTMFASFFVSILGMKHR